MRGRKNGEIDVGSLQFMVLEQADKDLEYWQRKFRHTRDSCPQIDAARKLLAKQMNKAHRAVITDFKKRMSPF